MLERIHIKNVAVIDEAEIEFNKGFNVLTGETGAGKSIIIDSINMVLGGRTSKSIIRNGETKAVAEAMFYVDDPTVLNALDANGIDYDDGMVLLYRDINTDGKSVCKINGSLTTASGLRSVAEMLINIHGQNDNQSLLTTSSHIALLNEYSEIATDLQAYRTEHEKVNYIEDKINSLMFDESEKERQIDLYSYQIDEIEKANLKPGEDEKLYEKRKFYNSIEKIAESVNSSYTVLYQGEQNVRDSLNHALSMLNSITEYDEKIDEIYQRLNSATIEIEDLVFQLRDYKDSINFDENDIDKTETRIDLINNLKRKYGATIEDILSYYEDISAKLESITKSDEEIINLKKELEIALSARKKLADNLTEKRKNAAEQLNIKICNELSGLDMPKANFKVNITPCDFNTNGCDNVEFLISVNTGEPLKPLSKIASGGEMSRIMLAIKSIFADSDYVETMIFDEIDTGVSGRAAQKIAEKINRISKNKQIICITHLPQIAAMANTHFLIEKFVEEGRTFTKVVSLDEENRKLELARIIGGSKITDTTVKAASEMIDLAKGIK